MARRSRARRYCCCYWPCAPWGPAPGCAPFPAWPRWACQELAWRVDASHDCAFLASKPPASLLFDGSGLVGFWLEDDWGDGRAISDGVPRGQGQM